MLQVGELEMSGHTGRPFCQSHRGKATVPPRPGHFPTSETSESECGVSRSLQGYSVSDVSCDQPFMSKGIDSSSAYGHVSILHERLTTCRSSWWLILLLVCQTTYQLPGLALLLAGPGKTTDMVRWQTHKYIPKKCPKASKSTRSTCAEFSDH